MRRYTSGYLRTHRWFTLQNLPPRQARPGWTQLLKVVLNLIQRGQPTPVPTAIATALGIDPSKIDEYEGCDFLPSEPPVWRHTIRGDEDHAQYPAQQFFDRYLLEALGDDRAALWLIQPEALITDILGADSEKFRDQQVDFYVPAAQLVIEIDGPQHRIPAQLRKDQDRDNYLLRRGIRTERIPTDQLANPSSRDARLRAIAALVASHPRVRNILDCAASTSDKHPVAAALTAALRLQVSCVELLLSGALDPTAEAWTVQLRTDVPGPWAPAALDDLCDLIEPLASMMRLEWRRPRLQITALQPGQSLQRNMPALDLSIARRWTDEASAEGSVVFCRSDYITTIPNQDGTPCDADYYRLEYDAPIRYTLREETDRPHLQRLLRRLFGHDDFREGQWPIIDSVLRRESSVGVLPTGGGKSLCYQLPALLQPGITLVVSPIRSLMRDQVAELQTVGFHRVAAISAENSPAQKSRKVADFASGHLQILLVTPERFQTAAFRDACLTAVRHVAVHHAVVDEVHCLSEWGHDFRTAYLNLGNAFRRFVADASVVGLTATASQNALTDIQLEFGIPDDRVFYPPDLKRSNLKFKVVQLSGSHQATAAKWLRERLALSTHNVPSGIFFTPHVNGRLGCQELAATLANKVDVQVGVFAGSRPKTFEGSDDEFETIKVRTQDGFKSGDLRLLCATKAFGMGVNKRDVRFTVHLGVPASMEALYQEAGRAGRDGEPADCVVIASPLDDTMQPALSPDIRPPELRALVDDSRRDSDLRTQLWLVTNKLRPLRDEALLLSQMLERLQRSATTSTLLSARDFQVDAETLERGIYRLAQLGFVTDWTVEDFFGGRYLVDYENRSDREVEEALLGLARRYSGDRTRYASLQSLCDDDPDALRVIFGSKRASQRDRLLYLLCYWSFRHFHYARRQSMQSVFKLCDDYPTLGEAKFRQTLEDFFTINTDTIRLRRFIETGIESIAEWPNLLEPDIKDSQPSQSDKRRHLEQLRGMIARLLESYESNVALDCISAAVRLRLDDYADPDGSRRLIRQLKSTRHTPQGLDSLFGFLLEATRHAPSAAQEQLARDVLECRPGRAMAIRIHDSLGDSYSAAAYLADLQPHLRTVIDRMENGLTGR